MPDNASIEPAGVRGASGRDPAGAAVLVIVAVLWVMAMSSAMLRPVPEPVTGGLKYLIDVNSAGAGELQLLPNVGPAISAAIIADREIGGPYTRVEDMERVKGIGPILVERFREYVRFSTLQQ